MRITPRQQQKRIILSRLVLDINETFRSYETDAEVILVAMTVRMGMYEGSPMDVSRVAKTVNLPRTTVRRHLARLKRHGVINTVRIGRRTVPLVSDRTLIDIENFYASIEKALRKAASDVAKMDT